MKSERKRRVEIHDRTDDFGSVHHLLTAVDRLCLWVSSEPCQSYLIRPLKELPNLHFLGFGLLCLRKAD